ncbi:MAG: dUTP pyrophosphatase [Oscillospiraceae bacterium]|jgi:dUTP pyrophosphatase|nr:dUTP pyrophosphatase [Oscillospiraceae bacterium]
MIDLYFAKLRDGAVIPSKRDEDAGYDIYACFDMPYIIIRQGETVLVPTGIASAFGKDYYVQLHERGSMAVRGIATRAGVIDSGYRGEWNIGLTNLASLPFVIMKHDAQAVLMDETGLDDTNAVLYPISKATCQAVLLPVPKARVTEISMDELRAMKSERGDGMMGSSRK